MCTRWINPAAIGEWCNDRCGGGVHGRGGGDDDDGCADGTRTSVWPQCRTAHTILLAFSD